MKSGFYGIVAFVTGFLVAQVSKFIIGRVSKNKRELKNFKEVVQDLVRSGGMPSGHSASFVALTTFLGLGEGFDSAIFALAVGITIIIIYDAVNVRYAVGEHGKLLNEIAKSDGNAKTKPQKLVEGHTVLEVIVGGLVGALIGVAVFMIFGINAAV
ncbi:divergent PAP2 family protein [Candidatus Saccharibacteria bacterium]|nr:divergent PAP2 family protein [Candidatus Saccharibacteria bacterium]